MLAKLTNPKIKSATLIETIISLLILMISFSCGMVIYSRILNTGVSDSRMNAELTAEVIGDSLVRGHHFENTIIKREEISYQISFEADAKYPDLLLLKITSNDGTNKPLLILNKFIKANENRQN